MAPVETPLDSVLGRVLAADVVAPFDLPRFDNSAMDGYALRSIDTRQAMTASPIDLRIAGIVDAGQGWQAEVPPASAIRIGTGAAVPSAFDAVVPFENVIETSASIALTSPVKAGDNIRRRGEDVKRGQPVLAAGMVLRPQEIGLLAAIGIADASVIPAARVGILSIGPELMSGAEPAQVPDANGPMLASLAQSAGATVVHIERSNGDRAMLSEQLQVLASKSDLILTSGGISNGPADTLTHLLVEVADVELWNLRLRPGKHYAAGKIADAVVLALPGNPISAFVGFLLFGRPAIDRLMGRPLPAPQQARAAHTISGSTGRFDAFRGYGFIDTDSVLQVKLVQNRGSGIVSSLPSANCLALLPEDVSAVAAGEPVEIRWVDHR